MMWRETRTRWLVLWGLMAVLAACGEEPLPDGLLIEPAHQTVSIAPGGDASVRVKLARTGTLTGAILVTGSAGPLGVGAEPLVLTSTESEGELVLRASELAEVGARGRVLLHAQSGSEAYSATLDVAVIPPWTLEFQSEPVSMVRSQSTTVSVALRRAKGFTRPVKLSLDVLPSGFRVDTREHLFEGLSSLAPFTLRTSYLTPLTSHALRFTSTWGRYSTTVDGLVSVTPSTTTSYWDPGFGDINGFILLGSGEDISSLAPLPDGGVVFVTSSGDSNSGLRVRQFDIEGKPDPMFGQMGVVDLSPPSATGYNWEPKLALQPDGKVLVLSHSSQRAYVYRLRRDGSLDTSFGGSGRVVLEFERYPGAVELLPLPGGSLLVGALTYGQLESVWLRADGGPDTGHGASGRRVIPVSDVRDHDRFALLADAQGRTLFVFDFRATGRPETGLQAVRMTAAGAVDASFGAEGRSAYHLSPDFLLSRVARVGDGFAAVGHVAKDSGTAGPDWVVRFGAQAGMLEHRWTHVAEVADYGYSSYYGLTALSDGRLMVVTNSKLRRLLPDGTNDAGFVVQNYISGNLYTGPADAVYSTNSNSVRRLLPPR